MELKESITYPVFEPNQILTSTHLNNLKEYLDEENRLTRTKLSGYGIFCGLEIGQSIPKDKISIKQGYGVTLEGYLIGLKDNNEYVKYKNYNLPKDSSYNPWIKNKKQIEIIEIFTSNTQAKKTSALKDIPAGKLKNRVVVLFLESKDVELKSCTGTSCDHKGKKRDFEVKVLLINKGDLDEIILDNILKRDEKLDEINIKRLHASLKELSPAITLKEVTKSDPLAKGYKEVIEEYRKKITKAIISAHTTYAGFLGLKDLDLQPINDLKNKHFDKETIQYAYDFIKDLILAYDEFRLPAYELLRNCCPKIPLFPRHLMLGRLNGNKGSETEKYRNYFINAPIAPEHDQKMLKAQWLFKRILSLIEGFDIKADPKTKIKITPSREDLFPLSERSIPYYYKNAAQLANLWNPDLGFKDKSKFHLSYNEDQYNKAPVVPHVKTPLNYSIDEYPFFRIEGHLGHGYKAVINEINKMKDEHNLSFEIIALKLSDKLKTVELIDSCSWKDLQAIFLDLRNTYSRLLQDLITNLQNITKSEEYLKILEKLKHITKCIETFSLESAFGDEGYGNLVQHVIEFKLKVQQNLYKLIHEEIESISAEEFQTRQNAFKETIRLIEKFLDHSIHVKLFTIYYSYKWRIEYLKKNHLSIFSNFAQKYPGLDHQAGVPKGGTFIIVHNENTEMDNSKDAKVIFDFTLPYAISCDCCDIPPCHSKEGQEMLIFPPLPRLYTTETDVGKKIEIPLIDAVYTFQESELIIDSFDKKTDSGGKVSRKVSQGNEIFGYQPPDKPGVDEFSYSVVDKKSKLKSIGKIFILVREKYSKHILAVDDMAATDKKTSIFIDVMANDISYKTTQLLLHSTNSAGPETTGFGAKIKVVKQGEKQLIQYIPGKAGMDSFKYKLKDDKRKEESIAEVSVFVYCCERECIEVVYKNKTGKIYVLNEKEIEEKADLKIFTKKNKYVDELKTEKGSAKVRMENRIKYIQYQPEKDFLGRDSFGVTVIGKDYTRTCNMNVIVICDCKESKADCELPNLNYTISPNVPLNINIHFDEVAPHVKVVRVGNVNPPGDIRVKVDPPKNIIEIQAISMDTVFTGQFPQYQFKYYGMDTRVQEECEATITLNKVNLTDTVYDNARTVDEVNNKYEYKDIITEDPAVTENINMASNFIVKMDGEIRRGSEYRDGNRNNAIVKEFKTTFDVLVKEILSIDRKITESGTTPELEGKKELNLKLAGAVLNIFFKLLRDTRDDIKVNSNIHIYFSDKLKKQVKSIQTSEKIDIVRESKIRELSSQLSRSDKPNYREMLGNLARP